MSKGIPDIDNPVDFGKEAKDLLTAIEVIHT